MIHPVDRIRLYEETLRRRPTFRFLRGLEKSQFESPELLRERQFTALKDLIGHAWSHCPYYRDQWEYLGLDPTSLSGPVDFRRWPILKRSDIRRHRDALRSRRHTRLITKSTGGSSGEPLKFHLNQESQFRRMAAAFRGYGWAGAGPGTRQWYLWGVPLNTSRFAIWKESMYHRWLYRHVVANCFQLGRESLPHFAESLRKARPEAIVAYAGALYELARLLREHNIRPFQPRTIVVGAESLHDFQRQVIESVFQAPVYETYGSREFMLIGCECERREGLHLTMEHLLVEIVDDDGQPVPEGEEGNVVITDLFNYGMPFIRYAIGDRARLSDKPCSCGRGLPLLGKVTGRSVDVLRFSNGRALPGEFFPHLLKDYDGVDRFQVIQHAPDSVELQIQTPGLVSRARESILARVREGCGEGVRVDLVEVPEISLTRHGKRRVVVNHMESPQGASARSDAVGV